MIVNTTNNDDNPVIIISGNIADETQACPGAMLTIGSKSNSHFQSLLPIEIFHLNSEARTQITHADYEGDNNESIEPYLHPIENEKKSTINSSQNKIPGFIYKNENTDIEFLIGPDGLIQCYSCKKFCKSLIQHLRMNKQCKEGIVIDDLKIQYHIFNSEAHKQKKRTHQIKSRQVKLENNPAGLKRAEKDRQDKSRQRKAEMDPVGKSMAEIKWQTKSRQVKLENNPGGFKKQKKSIKTNLDKSSWKTTQKDLKKQKKTAKTNLDKSNWKITQQDLKRKKKTAKTNLGKSNLKITQQD